MRALVLLLLGTTLVTERSVGERARVLADRVVFAQVLDTRTVTDGAGPRGMKTFTRVAVGEEFKGSGPAIFDIVQAGGSVGPYEAHIPGDARFRAGETAILLVRC